MQRSRPARDNALFALAGCLFWPALSHAISWDYVPVASLGALYESNPRGASESSREDDAYAGSATAQLTLSGETPTSGYYFRPRAEGAIYNGAERSSDLDYFNYYLPIDARWTRPMSQYGLNADYSKVSTRNFPSVDPNNPTLSTTQRLLLDEYMERWSISPNLLLQMTPRDLLSLSLNFADVSFNEAEATGRSDYNTSSVEVMWQRSYTERHKLSLSANASSFTSDVPFLPPFDVLEDIENDTTSYGAYAGYEYAWSESTDVGFTAGMADSEVEVTLPVVPEFVTVSGQPVCFNPSIGLVVNCKIKTDDQNFIGEAFLRQKTGDTIDTEISIGRSIQPSSDGAEVTQDTFRAFLTKRFTARLWTSIGAIYSKQDAVAADTATRVGQRFSRNWWSGDATLGWKITEQWELQSRYGYYLDEYDEAGGYSVPRHRLQFSVHYSGLRRR